MNLKGRLEKIESSNANEIRAQEMATHAIRKTEIAMLEEAWECLSRASNFLSKVSATNVYDQERLERIRQALPGFVDIRMLIDERGSSEAIKPSHCEAFWDCFTDPPRDEDLQPLADPEFVLAKFNALPPEKQQVAKEGMRLRKQAGGPISEEEERILDGSYKAEIRAKRHSSGMSKPAGTSGLSLNRE